VSVKVNGIAINAKAPVTVTPGAPSATTSKVSFAASTVVSGQTNIITVEVRDAEGNLKPGLAATEFAQPLLSGGTSAGTFGKAADSPAAPGFYKIPFFATTAGTASSLSVTVSSVVLKSNPTITVTVGNVSPLSTVTPATTSTNSGVDDILTIVVKDDANNAVSGLLRPAFLLRTQGGTSTGTFALTVTESSTTPGTYTLAFKGEKAGTPTTIITNVNGTELNSKPTIQVNPGAVSSKTSSAEFAAPTVQAKKTVDLKIHLNDAAGNPVPGKAASISFKTSAGVVGAAAESKTVPGRYTATFTAGATGPATISAIVDGVEIKSNINVVP
jgi:hypothetical protein